MHSFRVRFEQGRGHFMVVDREAPILQEKVDDYQVRMLQACDVPGLLRLDSSTIDGVVTFRYALAGTRMLSQSLRSAKWSMQEMMAAICRLAEVVEDSRHYALDADRFVLQDDFIFVGHECDDIRLVYLPMDTDAIEETLNEKFERLLVRWFMHVPQVEGTAIQSLLRLTSSKDFTPSSLRAFARSYLAGVKRSVDDQFSQPVAESTNRSLHDSERERATSLKDVAASADQPPENWRWFKPQTDPHSLSELLAEDSYEIAKGVGASEASELMGQSMDKGGAKLLQSAEIKPAADLGRMRIWFVCGAIVLSGAAWRLFYAGHASNSGMWMATGLTIILISAVVGLWNGLPTSREKKQYQNAAFSGEVERESIESDLDRRGRVSDRPPDRIPDRFSGRDIHESRLEAPINAHMPEIVGTQELSLASDATEILKAGSELGARTGSRESCFLVWESRGNERISLQGISLIIGRSGEASQHVDDSKGISRAHLELVRTPEGWCAKDLGSRNGTSLNGTPMAPYETYPLKPDDTLDVVESRYRFKIA